MYARMLAVNGYLPEKILTNSDLEKMIDTTDAWIVERSGIHQRHIVSQDENSVTMAIEASRGVLEMSGVAAQEIDLILMATCTPSQLMPGCACSVQAALGNRSAGAMDINAACSGFIYALSVADQFIRNDQARTVLVVGSDAMSQIVDWQDRATCILFGDGAGAVLLRADTQPGILSTHIAADGHFESLLYAEGNALMGEKPKVQMKGREVYKRAVQTLGQLVKDALLKSGLKASEIDWLVPHQANWRIIKLTAQLLDLSMDRVIATIGTHANTSAASIPLALYQAMVVDRKIKPNDVLLLEAFGAGLTWGSALMRV